MPVGGGPFDERADVDECLSGSLGHRMSEEFDAAGRCEDQAEQHAHRRGLARPVGAEEAVAVSLAHVEVDPVDSDD